MHSGAAGVGHKKSESEQLSDRPLREKRQRGKFGDAGCGLILVALFGRLCLLLLLDYWRLLSWRQRGWR